MSTINKEGSMSESTVSAKGIVEESKRRGYLAKQLYVVFTTPVNGIGPVMESLVRHLEFQEQLEREGIMFAAGPNWTDDEQNWDGEGMVVIRAASLVEAQAIAARDPMHQSGARNYRVRPWLVNEGRLTVELDFASGRFRLS
jgi:uncharacterized protein